MNTTRCAKWGKDALAFLNAADDKSLVLDIIVSYSCMSQSGEGFEELVNLMNSELVKKKVKKINLLDTSYLYRHTIPEFAKYSDKSIPTDWFLKNQEAISNFELEVNLRSWLEEVSTDDFKKWYKQVLLDYRGDENGEGIVQTFRDLVIAEASVASYKGNKSLEGCIEFMLEECAHACATFRGTVNLVYPMKMSRPVEELAGRYNISINHLRYRASVQTQSGPDHISRKVDEIDREVALFMKEKVTNVNFFVMDKFGNHIYKNNSYDTIVGDINFGRLDPRSWAVSQEVMSKGKQTIVEEKYQGRNYLSVKSPLVIDNKVEGVIGLAIEITSRKKAQELEMTNKLQELELRERRKVSSIAERVAHDIRSPLVTLSMVAKTFDKIPESGRLALQTAISSINNIANELLDKYQSNIESAASFSSFPVVLSICDIIKQKKYQYKGTSIKFEFDIYEVDKFTFVKGVQSDFSRMMSNIINNAVEALSGDDKRVKITASYTEDSQMKICVSDNGRGMSQELVDRIMNGEAFTEGKESGHGIGFIQINETLKKLRGKLSIESKVGSGTKTSICIPTTQTPNWIAQKLVLHEGDIVVVLDDEPSIYSVWGEKLREFGGKLQIKYFTDGPETVDFIKSVSDKSRIVLLSDFEFRNQKSDGLQLIGEVGVDRSILFTNDYDNQTVLNVAKREGVKVLPKPLVGDIHVSFKENETKKAKEIVIIDDNEEMLEALAELLSCEKLAVYTYSNPDSFLKNLSKHGKHTRILIDHDLDADITGFDLAKQLKEAGYEDLFILSGKRFEASEVPEYLTVVLKEDADKLQKSLLVA